MNWISFFRTLTVASGSAARGDCPPMSYTAVTAWPDAGLNIYASIYHMLPLPGGRGDLGHSELAALHIMENVK